jgi:hypothetical protein
LGREGLACLEGRVVECESPACAKADVVSVLFFDLLEADPCFLFPRRFGGTVSLIFKGEREELGGERGIDEIMDEDEEPAN